MGVGDVAQGGPAGHIRAVGELLHRHVRPAAQGRKDRLGRAIGGVADAVLDDRAAVHRRAVGGVGVLRVVGMDRVGVVRRHHEAVGHGLGAVLAEGGAYPLRHVSQERAVRPLLGEAAHLLVVQQREHRHAGRLFSLHKAPEAAVGALEVIQHGRGHKLVLRPPDQPLLPQAEEQVRAQDVPGLAARRLGHNRPEAALLQTQPHQGDHVGLGVI